jgi:prevent-host-death family protein
VNELENLMKRIPVSEVKDDLSRYLRPAETEEIVITRHGKPAGDLIGLASDQDWFDYGMKNDPAFLQRTAAARASIRAGRGAGLQEVEDGG